MDIHDGALPLIEGYGCATCGVPLTVITTPDARRTFLHPGHSRQDHDPDPVPLAQLTNTQLLCDFCSAPNPVATFTFGHLDVLASTDTTGIQMHNLGNSWAACEGCARLVEQHDPEGLTQRAAKRARRQGRSVGAQALRPLHQALFTATPTTPVRRPLTSNSTTQRTGTATPVPAASEVRSPRPQMLPKVRDRLVRFWRTSGRAHLLDMLASGETYGIPGHMFPGATLDAPAARVDARNPEALRQYTALMANHAENARIFWIDPDFTTLAAHAARDLSDVRIEPVELPAPGGLLIWHTPIYQPVQPETGMAVPIVAAHWGPVPGGVWITFYTPAEVLVQGRPLTERDLQELRERIGWLSPVSTGAGLRFSQPNAPASEQTRLMLCSLIATWILITQPDAEITNEPADKATRQAYQRANRPAPLVRIVRIRRKQQPQSHTGNTPTRVYTRRWWVSGFFREQPYGPGRALRRRTYVRPHVKGPADAPLILSHQVHVLGNPRNQNQP